MVTVPTTRAFLHDDNDTLENFFCITCGEAFERYASQRWRIRCVSCWQAGKHDAAQKRGTHPEIKRLKAENERLLRLSEAQQQANCELLRISEEQQKINKQLRLKNMQLLIKLHAHVSKKSSDTVQTL